MAALDALEGVLTVQNLLAASKQLRNKHFISLFDKLMAGKPTAGAMKCRARTIDGTTKKIRQMRSRKRHYRHYCEKRFQSWLLSSFDSLPGPELFKCTCCNNPNINRITVGEKSNSSVSSIRKKRSTHAAKLEVGDHAMPQRTRLQTIVEEYRNSRSSPKRMKSSDFLRVAFGGY